MEDVFETGMLMGYHFLRQELETNSFRAPAYKSYIGMSYSLLDNENVSTKSVFKNIWLGLDLFKFIGNKQCEQLLLDHRRFNQQYAVPNYLTGRQINAKVTGHLLRVPRHQVVS